MDNFLIKYEIVGNEEQEYIQQGIGSSTCCVTEGHSVHEPRKKRVEQINKLFNPLGHACLSA
jgi:hypothetical protein